MSCLDCGRASKAVKHAGPFLLAKITGIEFQARECLTTQVFICQAEKRGGDERLCWFMLLHSYIRPPSVKNKNVSSLERT